MMAKNLKNLEYLKYHYPDSKRGSVNYADGPFNTQQYQTILYTYFEQKYSTPSIRFFHLYEQDDER